VGLSHPPTCNLDILSSTKDTHLSFTKPSKFQNPNFILSNHNTESQSSISFIFSSNLGCYKSFHRRNQEWDKKKKKKKKRQSYRLLLSCNYLYTFEPTKTVCSHKSFGTGSSHITKPSIIIWLVMFVSYYLQVHHIIEMNRS